MRLALLVTVTLCVTSLAAHADTFQLNYLGRFPLTFDVSTPIVPASVSGDTFYIDEVETLSGGSYRLGFAQSGAEYCAAVGDSNLTIGFNGTACDVNDFTGIDFSLLGVGTVYYGPPASPTFNVVSSSAFGETLTITDLSASPSVTPEPSSFALLGTGLLGIAGVANKRYV